MTAGPHRPRRHAPPPKRPVRNDSPPRSPPHLIDDDRPPACERSTCTPTLILHALAVNLQAIDECSHRGSLGRFSNAPAPRASLLDRAGTIPSCGARRAPTVELRHKYVGRIPDRTLWVWWRVKQRWRRVRESSGDRDPSAPSTGQSVILPPVGIPRLTKLILPDYMLARADSVEELPLATADHHPPTSASEACAGASHPLRVLTVKGGPLLLTWPSQRDCPCLLHRPHLLLVLRRRRLRPSQSSRR